MIRTKKIWYLFYNTNNDRLNRVIYDIENCKQPSKTDSYKVLKANFNKGNISGYGFTDNKEDIDIKENWNTISQINNLI